MASRKSHKNQPASLCERTPRPTETRSANGEEKAAYDPAREVLIRCLERVTADDTGHFIENPAVQFTDDAKDGKYDDLSDEDYNILLCKVEELAALWHEQPRRTAGEILLSLLEQITIPLDRLEAIAGPLWNGTLPKAAGWVGKETQASRSVAKRKPAP